MALADVRRGISLFRKTETPIIGVIENMAWLETSDGDRQYIFGQGGAEAAAQSLDAPFLGHIPLFPALREFSDKGEVAPDGHAVRRIFEKLAARIADSIPPATRQ